MSIMIDSRVNGHPSSEDVEIEPEDTSSGQDASITKPFNPNSIKINTPLIPLYFW